MLRIIPLLLICKLLLSCSPIKEIGVENSRAPIPPEQLIEDWNVFKKHLKEVHACLYTYTKEKEFSKKLNTMESLLSDTMSSIDFYRFLAPLQQEIKNGHSMIIPSESWDDYKREEAKFFPFEVWVRPEEMFITKNLSSDTLQLEGARILSINGKSASDLIAYLLNHVTSDGNNITYPLAKMSLGFSEWYADIMGTPDLFDIEVQLEDGKVVVISLRAECKQMLDDRHLKRYHEKRLPWYIQEYENILSLKMLANYAILTVPSFDKSTKDKYGKKYKSFYKRAFREIKENKVERLILDLRDNGGGDSGPQLELLRHLIADSILLFKRTHAITNKIPDSQYYKYDKVKWLNTVAKLALKKRKASYEPAKNFIARSMNAAPQKPSAPRKYLFTGELFILMDGESFSATGEVLGHLKDKERGLFIGEEAGGNPSRVAAGVMPMLTLPNSGVRVRLSVLCFENNVSFENKGRGVMPDYEIIPSIHEFLANQDVVLDFATELISKRIQKSEEKR